MKRITFSLKDEDLIKLLESMKGRKSAFIECALKCFIKSETGRNLIDAWAKPSSSNQDKKVKKKINFDDLM